MDRSLARVTLLAVTALAGCLASEAQLRQRAAADFQCDPGKLQVTTKANDVHHVAGCGQEEDYVFNKEASAWLKESESGGRVITAPPSILQQ